MRKMKNSVHLEGYLYEHDLALKTTGEKSKNPGTDFISGTISIATDDDLMNIVQVHFTYSTATTASGKPNATFNLLKQIIDGKIGTVMEHGKENAGLVRMDSAIALNEWYDTKSEDHPLISVKRNEGGFLHTIQMNEMSTDPDKRATFDVDMLITGARRIEPDEERNLPEKMILKGYIFDFRNSILPVEFSVLLPAAMNYFESLGATGKTPTFTKVSGIQVSKTIVREKKEEGAFGDVKVTEIRNTQRDFVVTWATQEPYEWDVKETLLASEVAEAISNRELYLADIKRRQDEYAESKKAGAFNSTTSTAKKEYDF